MNHKEFMKLVEPINMLIGYCQSAADITSESDLKKWSIRIIQLADNLQKVWRETALNEINDQETK